MIERQVPSLEDTLNHGLERWYKRKRVRRISIIASTFVVGLMGSIGLINSLNPEQTVPEVTRSNFAQSLKQRTESPQRSTSEAASHSNEPRPSNNKRSVSKHATVANDFNPQFLSDDNGVVSMVRQLIDVAGPADKVLVGEISESARQCVQVVCSGDGPRDVVCFSPVSLPNRVTGSNGQMKLRLIAGTNNDSEINIRAVAEPSSAIAFAHVFENDTFLLWYGLDNQPNGPTVKRASPELAKSPVFIDMSGFDYENVTLSDVRNSHTYLAHREEPGSVSKHIVIPDALPFGLYTIKWTKGPQEFKRIVEISP